MVGEETAVETPRAGRRIIERPRLTRLLSETESRVLLLVAPAGYGKTTLARQWLSGRKHAWYQVTSASTDVAALALGLANAAQAVLPGAGTQLRGRLKTTSNPAADASSLADELAAELASWPRDVNFFIDDYHLLAGTDAGETFVNTLIARTSIPYLIASRTRPSWVSAKNLLYGEGSELGRTALAMTHEEAASALPQREELPGLISLADGWPAVIGLAALLHLPISGSDDAVPATLHEYFAEELYQNLSRELKWQVAQLAMAPVLNDVVAIALFGDEARSVLQSAYDSGFLSRGLGEHEMHPLLRHFLKAKLGEFQLSKLERSARKIADAYAEALLWDEAVSVAEEFEIQDTVLRVLDNALEPALSEGRVASVERWLDAARRHAPTSSIVRLAGVEVAFRKGNTDTARLRATELVRSISTEDPVAPRVYLRAGTIAHLDDRVAEAVELFSAAEERARTPTDLRRAIWSRFVSLTDMDDREGAQTALGALERLPAIGVDDLLRRRQAQLQSALRWGNLRPALEMSATSLELVGQCDDPYVRTGFLQTYGVALVLSARYREADDTAVLELREAERFKLEWVIPHALEMRASAAIGQRRFNPALKMLSRVQQLASDNAHTKLNVDVLKARIHICSGSPERAASLLHDRQDDAIAISPGMRGDYLATQGLALICWGRTADGRALLDASEAATTHLEARVLSAFGRTIASYIEAGGEVDAGELTEACVAARETGNFDAFVTAYRACPALVAKLEDANLDVGPFVVLVEELDASLASTLGLHRRTQVRAPGDPLTPREREVLELVRQGLSNRQIARTLWIAESTVKVHVRHVFDKLGVRSRTEAATLPADDV